MPSSPEKARARAAKWYRDNPERVRARVAEWKKKHPDVVRAINAQHYVKNREKYIARAHKWNKENPEPRRVGKVKYKRTPHAKKKATEYGRRAQGLPIPTRPEPATCECCGRAPMRYGVPTALSLDHDHTTGKFRGWLCNRCNLGIGMLDDTLTGLQNAISYLRRASQSRIYIRGTLSG
jgi:hypothetical protein